jgi:stress response protein YsnF
VGDEARLDVVEERLNIGKRLVDRGGVRVRRVVTERPVEEQVTLRDETINVDRRTVDRRVEGTADDSVYRADLRVHRDRRRGCRRQRDARG